MLPVEFPCPDAVRTLCAGFLKLTSICSAWHCERRIKRGSNTIAMHSDDSSFEELSRTNYVSFSRPFPLISPFEGQIDTARDLLGEPSLVLTQSGGFGDHRLWYLWSGWDRRTHTENGEGVQGRRVTEKLLQCWFVGFPLAYLSSL